MHRRQFLQAAAGALATAQPLPRRPNIVLLFADDLGYAGIGAQGSDIPTPHIDSIARNGVRFTNGYVSCPVCSPTRAGLMTGRYQQRFGHEFNPGPAGDADDDFGLPLSETTIADRLKKLGYATGMVGKWHLGYKPELQPRRRGFDEFFGFLGGANPYIDPNSRGPILRGESKVEESEYLTDAFRREALAFLDRHKSEPFFLYLAFNAVHNPLQAIAKYEARFASIQDQRRRTYAAMTAALDDSVGAVLAKLREAGQENNTLVFFISDNGGPTPQTTSSNAPLRGFKGQTYEGGVRVPFLMQWKGRIPAGKVDARPVIALDVHPTAVAAAGGSIPAGTLDGVNLLPHAAGDDTGRPHQSLYWRFGSQWAIRQGDWKLVHSASEKPELFDLANDASEATNLAAAQPERAAQLESAWRGWSAGMAAPRWGRPDRGAAKKGKQRRKQR